MTHFKADFDAMSESTSNNDAVNMKIMTITLQSDVNGIFGKKNIKKTAFFCIKLFLQEISLFLVP